LLASFRTDPLRRQILTHWLLLTVLCIPLCYLVVTVPFSGERIARTADNAWYLNRGYLMWRGIFDGAFVYNLGYPALAGTINLLTHELPAAGIIVNWLSVYGIISGTFVLGCLLYNRSIAWLAVLVIATNTALYRSARLMQTFILFQAVVVWCVILACLLIRRRQPRLALLLGLCTAFALYTRLEGGAYALLILFAGGSIYAATRTSHIALRLTLIGGGVFAVGFIFYALVLLRNSDVGGGAAFSLLALLRANPIPWDEVSRRWTDALTSITGNWPLWAWLIAFAGLIWSNPRFRSANWLCAGLIGLNLTYLFLLATWPAPRYANHFLPFFALLFAVGLWQLYQRWPRLWFAVPLGIVAVVIPGLLTLQSFSYVPRVSYWEYASAKEAQAIDSWLAGQGWGDKEVFTLCQGALPFIRSNVHLVYRLSLKADTDTNWPDSPPRLLSAIRQNDKLFMTCQERIEYPDWKAYLDNPAGQTEQLQAVGTVGDYTFYRVVQGKT
jgi:hypothetical protein